MSATSAATTTDAETDAEGTSPELSEKQGRILAYLRERAGEQTYFKSRTIGDALDLSAKEVGTNMPALQDAAGVDVDIEKWGYSSGTTWMVTT